MLKCLRNGFWIVIVQKIQKKCLSQSGKMHFSVSGHVTYGVVRWRHELDYICLLWVLSKFGPIEAYRCRVIANWFFPSNSIKRYFNGPLTDANNLKGLPVISKEKEHYLWIQRHHLLKLDIIENKPTILWLPTGSPCLSILKHTKVNLSLSRTSKWLPC